MTLLEMAIEKFGSVAKMAEAMETARSPLSSALHGHVARSRVYWAAVGRALGLSPSEMAPFLHGDMRRYSGGGTRAGSIRAKT